MLKVLFSVGVQITENEIWKSCHVPLWMTLFLCGTDHYQYTISLLHCCAISDTGDCRIFEKSEMATVFLIWKTLCRSPDHYTTRRVLHCHVCFTVSVLQNLCNRVWARTIDLNHIIKTVSDWNMAWILPPDMSAGVVTIVSLTGGSTSITTTHVTTMMGLVGSLPWGTSWTRGFSSQTCSTRSCVCFSTTATW